MEPTVERPGPSLESHRHDRRDRAGPAAAALEAALGEAEQLTHRVAAPSHRSKRRDSQTASLREKVNRTRDFAKLAQVRRTRRPSSSLDDLYFEIDQLNATSVAPACQHDATSIGTAI